jgi:hypothetical protein
MALVVSMLHASFRPALAVLDIEDRGTTLTAGGLAMRITNAGILGNAFFDTGLSFDPSFEIEPGSGYEALNHAQLWVGAVLPGGEHRVSGGPILEWRPTLAPDDTVLIAEKGRLGAKRFVDDDGDGAVDEETLDGRDNDADGEVDEDIGLFSHQMTAANYVDDRPEAVSYFYEGGESHVPLGLDVHQEAYVWSAPGFEGVVGVTFKIKNHGNQLLRNLYLGTYADLDSRGRNDRRGHLDDRVENVVYRGTAFEGAQNITAGGIPVAGGPCPTVLTATVPVVHDGVDGSGLPYVAVVGLDHTIDPLGFITPAASYARAPTKVGFRYTVFARGRLPEDGGPPLVDRDRYEALSGALEGASTDLRADYAVLVSCGPFARLEPGQSLEFSIALVGTLDPDAIATRMANAAISQHGLTRNLIPDINPPGSANEWYAGVSGRVGHEVCISAPPGFSFMWDPHCPSKFPPDVAPGESPQLYTSDHCIWTDADCNSCTGVGGKETRDRWLEAADLPPPPGFRTTPLDNAIRIEWDNRPEIQVSASDFGANVRFGGYRVYKMADWRRRSSLLPPAANWSLVGAFALDTTFGQQRLSTVTDTTIDYERILFEKKLYPVGRYAVTDTQVLNGFDYVYFVATVYERRYQVLPDQVRLDIIESPFTPSYERRVAPQRAASASGSRVWVVPNPFRGAADWDNPPVLGNPLTRHVDFMGLPKTRCTIKVWTVSGDFVAQIDHDGSGGDGQAAWNLVSRNGQEVSSGIYLFTVDSSLGQQMGRFVIVR